MLQVVPIDSQHFVVATEPAVLSSQAAFQKVKDENPRLVRSAHQLDAELFVGVTLVQGHVETILSLREAVTVVVSSAPKASLSEHGQVQRRARLGKDGPGMVVGHVADIKVIDLKEKN